MKYWSPCMHTLNQNGMLHAVPLVKERVSSTPGGRVRWKRLLPSETVIPNVGNGLPVGLCRR